MAVVLNSDRQFGISAESDGSPAVGIVSSIEFEDTNPINGFESEFMLVVDEDILPRRALLYVNGDSTTHPITVNMPLLDDGDLLALNVNNQGLILSNSPNVVIKHIIAIEDNDITWAQMQTLKR